MEEENKSFLSGQLYILMGILALIRVYVGHAVGVWFPASQMWDDNIMMQYARTDIHFKYPTRSSLLKDMSFPFFVKFASLTGLPYTVILSMAWVLAAVLTYIVATKLFKKKVVPFIVYVYVLFLPQAFEAWAGTRLYRNGMIDPFVISTLGLMILMIMSSAKKGVKKIVLYVCVGLLFPFTYYIKEDGMWLMACLLLATVMAVVNIIYSKTIETKECETVSGNKFSVLKKSLLPLACALIPLIIFNGYTSAYKALNNHFFGVYEINTRTESEYGEFLTKIYKIESDNRSKYVWTPYDAVVKAFDASPTLSQYPELLDAIAVSGWCGGNVYEKEYLGDMFGWMLREEMFLLNMYKSEAEFKDFFAKVNDELDDAFKNGILKKQSGVIQLNSSSGGYTWEEVKGLTDEVKAGFEGAILYKEYAMGLSGVTMEEIDEHIELIEAVEEMTRLNYLADYSKKLPSSMKMIKIISPLVVLYKVVNVVAVVLLIIVLVGELIYALINIKSLKTFVAKRCKIYLGFMGTAVFAGISLLYSFAIGWFASFLFEDGLQMLVINFYNIALPGLLMFAYMFAIFTTTEHVKFVLTKRGDAK